MAARGCGQAAKEEGEGEGKGGLHHQTHPAGTRREAILPPPAIERETSEVRPSTDLSRDPTQKIQLKNEGFQKAAEERGESSNGVVDCIGPRGRTERVVSARHIESSDLETCRGFTTQRCTTWGRVSG